MQAGIDVATWCGNLDITKLEAKECKSHAVVLIGNTLYVSESSRRDRLTCYIVLHIQDGRYAGVDLSNPDAVQIQTSCAERVSKSAWRNKTLVLTSPHTDAVSADASTRAAGAEPSTASDGFTKLVTLLRQCRPFSQYVTEAALNQCIEDANQFFNESMHVYTVIAQVCGSFNDIIQASMHIEEDANMSSNIDGGVSMVETGLNVAVQVTDALPLPIVAQALNSILRAAAGIYKSYVNVHLAKSTVMPQLQEKLEDIERVLAELLSKDGKWFQDNARQAKRAFHRMFKILLRIRVFFSLFEIQSTFKQMRKSDSFLEMLQVFANNLDEVNMFIESQKSSAQGTMLSEAIWYLQEQSKTISTLNRQLAASATTSSATDTSSACADQSPSADVIKEIHQLRQEIRSKLMSPGSDAEALIRFANNVYRSIDQTIEQMRTNTPNLPVDAVNQLVQSKDRFQDYISTLQHSAQSELGGDPMSPAAVNLHAALLKLRAKRLREIQKNPTYVSLRCGPTPYEPADDSKSVTDTSVEKVIEAIFTEQNANSVQSLLLLGPSGAGKSTILQRIEALFWHQLDTVRLGITHQFFPVFMELKRRSQPQYKAKDLRDIALAELGGDIKAHDLDELKTHLSLTPIWIFDGFDEMGKTLPLSSTLHACGLSIVSCRQQFVDTVLKDDLHSYFAPVKSASKSPLHIRYLRGFSRGQIREYLTSLLLTDPNLAMYGTPEGFENAIFAVPSLADLATNPFSLSLIVTEIPRLAQESPTIRAALVGSSVQSIHTLSVEEGEDTEDDVVSEYRSTDIFGAFVRRYIERSLERFSDHPRWPEGFETDFYRECLETCEKLAVIMYSQDVKTFEVSTHAPECADLFDTRSGGMESDKRWFVLQAIPLRKSGANRSFLHKSLCEYFVASRNVRFLTEQVPRLRARHERIEQTQLAIAEVFGFTAFAQESDLVQKHAELLTKKGDAQTTLEELILYTRTKNDSRDQASDQMLVRAASNAITVLNYGTVTGLLNFRFSHVADWSRIRIPGCNLNQAQIIGCNFDGADLSGATLIQAILRDSTFRKANFTDVYTGEIAPLQGHTEQVSTVCFNMTGELVVSASHDRSLAVWHVGTGRCVASLKRHALWITSVDWCHVNDLVATASTDQNVIIWDVANEQVRATLHGHTRGVWCVRWSSDGTMLASGGWDNTVRIWDARTFLGLLTLHGHEGNVMGLTWSPDDAYIASASVDSTIRIWNTHSGACENVLRLDSYPTSISWNPTGGHRIVAGCENHMLNVWNVQTGTREIVLEGHTAEVKAVSWSPDGGFLASGADDMTVRIWDVASGKCTAVLQGHTLPVTSVSWKHDSLQLVSGSADHTVRLWDLSARRNVVVDHAHQDLTPVAVQWSVDESTILSATCKSVVYWKTATGQRHIVRPFPATVPDTPPVQLDAIMSAVWSPRLNSIATGHRDGKIVIWNALTHESIHIVSGHDDEITTLSWRGEVLVSGARDGTICIWNPTTGEKMLSPRGHDAWVHQVALNPSGTHLASGSRDKTVVIWDIQTGENLHTYTAHTGSVKCLDWSPNGRYIASGGFDTTICVLRGTDSFDTLVTLRGHTAQVRSVCWNQRSTQIASGADDGTVRIWLALTGECVATLTGHSLGVHQVRWSKDHMKLMSASEDRTIRLWTTLHVGTRHVPLVGVLGSSYALDMAADFTDAIMDESFRRLTESHGKSRRANDVGGPRSAERKLLTSKPVVAPNPTNPPGTKVQLQSAANGNATGAKSAVAESMGIQLCTKDQARKLSVDNSVSNITLVIAGSSAVGKTSIVRNVLGHDFDEACGATIGASYCIRYFNVRGYSYCCRLWDTAGQERYRGLAGLYFKNATAILFVYSVVDDRSCSDLHLWLRSAEAVCREDTVIGVVGNKTDLAKDRESCMEAGQGFAQSKGLPHYECSARESEGERIVYSFIQHVLAKRPELTRDEVELDPAAASGESQRSKRCCKG